MSLEKNAKKKLEKLLEMSQENFLDMYELWEGLENDSRYTVRNSQDFRLGYIFGKIEHKFISWFYSEFGRSQTDQEYEEFWNMVKDFTLKMKLNKN